MAVRTALFADDVTTLSPALIVTLRAEQINISALDERPPIQLDLLELRLLPPLTRRDAPPLRDVIAAIAEGPGDAERLHVLVDQLRERALLADGAGATFTPADDTHLPKAQSRRESFAVDDRLVLMTPLVLRVSPEGFECLDHTGRLRIRLDPVELAAASAFQRPRTKPEALDKHSQEAGQRALSESQFEELIDRLAEAGLLRPSDAEGPDSREKRVARVVMAQLKNLGDASERAVERHDAAERERKVRTGTQRIPVVPIDVNGSPIPLALGMVIAYARAHEGGRLDNLYRFVPQWLMQPPRLRAMTREPGIFLFSNYLWSHAQNLGVSERIKQASPSSVTIHGGPDTPKYEGDAEAYFRVNPHVDIAVRGEGEATTAEVFAALSEAFDDGWTDLSVLRDVPGITFRDGDEIVRTADRERIAELDTIPSPFLTGLFDVHGESSPIAATIETNRGCPYGCSFCDWGSATLSRIRKFDLERVFAELEWCAQHRIPRVMLADANFGILERDVEIAEKVAQLKDKYGYPRVFATNYAKNTTKHVKHIVETLANAGILTEGILSLQSLDTDTLNSVNRSNIKVEKYDDLAREFRKAKLPLMIDLMMGLPGATMDSFRDDLQGCVDREVYAKIFPTELLVNSPMNDPEYRQAHEIETSAPLAGLIRTTRTTDGKPRRALVVGTTTFTRADYEEMSRLREVYLLCENFGVLRQVSRYVRQEVGLPEVGLYERLRTDARAHPEQWPVLAFTCRVVPTLGAEPVSWRLFIDEIKAYLTTMLNVPDDAALDTVLRVQHALLPAFDRTFPHVLELPHDYTAWHRAMLDAKDGDHRSDWPSVIPRLREYPPATFTVRDPHQVCARGMGFRIEEQVCADWELESPVGRAMPAEHLEFD